LPEVWLGLWVEGFDGMEGEIDEMWFEFVNLRKFIGNSFKEGDLLLEMD
jgi:hypothetical protein